MASDAEVGAALERLRDLYSHTGEDWVLSASQILTEPVCPSVSIAPETHNILRYSYRASGPISDLIVKAADHVYREVVLKEGVGHAMPLSNPDDDAFLTWLQTRGPFPQSESEKEREDDREARKNQLAEHLGVPKDDIYAVAQMRFLLNQIAHELHNLDKRPYPDGNGHKGDFWHCPRCKGIGQIVERTEFLTRVF